MILVDPRNGSYQISYRGKVKYDFLDSINAQAPGLAKLAKPQLDSGDFAFEGSGPTGDVLVGVERKSLSDAMASIRSGRYAGDQMIKMSQTYDYCYLVIEGIYKPSESGYLDVLSGREWEPLKVGKTIFMYSELDNFITSLELHKNVMVKRSGSRDETVHILCDLHNWWQKSWESHKSTEAIKTQVGSVYQKASVLRMVAAQLPGIGWGRSKKVEAKFGSIERMVQATEEDWVNIEGIGKQTARKVIEAIRGK